MATNERIRKYLDAGSVLGQVSRGRAEEIVRELVNAGDIQRGQAQEWVDSLVDRSRRSSEQVLDVVRAEVAAQLQRVDGSSLEVLAGQVAEILKKSADAGRSATRGVAGQAGKTAQRAKGVTDQATKRAKGVTSQTAQRAKGVTSQATKTAKGVTSQATRTAQGVRSQATKTATRARSAATKVTPSRAAPPAGRARPKKAAS